MNIEQAAFEAEAQPAKYHHVAVWKFVLLSIATFGLYELYWFYKSWRFIRARDESKIKPVWRTIFAPIWFYSLAEDIESERNDGDTSGRAMGLAAAYFLLQAAWRLPDPYWLVSFLTVLMFLPLLRDVDVINRADGVEGVSYRRFTFRHIVVAFLGLLFFAFTALMMFGNFPDTKVQTGSELPKQVVSMLENEGLLSENENIIYFYSSGLFSYKEDGNYYTEERVVSYWSEGGEFYNEQATYSEIEDIQIEYSASFLDDTQLVIHRRDGSAFVLLVSEEGGKDKQFVNRLMRLWREVRGAT